MLAFAANSILCRLALLDKSIDATSFTFVRILSGAFILSLLVFYQKASFKEVLVRPPSRFVIALSAYAVAFSYAYIQLPAASGALVLFTSVQITMLLYSLYQGKRYSLGKWLAYGLCIIGFLMLLLPNSNQAEFIPLLLMIMSGVAWGSYSLFAQNIDQPLQRVQQAFLWSVPIVLFIFIFVFVLDDGFIYISNYGLLLACLSGVLASGLGYFIWYIALQKITTFNAAIAQLTVPVITAGIAIVFLGENLSLQFILASILIISGLLINLYQPK